MRVNRSLVHEPCRRWWRRTATRCTCGNPEPCAVRGVLDRQAAAYRAAIARMIEQAGPDPAAGAVRRVA